MEVLKIVGAIILFFAVFALLDHTIAPGIQNAMSDLIFGVFYDAGRELKIFFHNAWAAFGEAIGWTIAILIIYTFAKKKLK